MQAKLHLTFRGIEARFQQLDTAQQRMEEEKLKRERKLRKIVVSEMDKALPETAADVGNRVFITSVPADAVDAHALLTGSARVAAVIHGVTAASRERMQKVIRDDVGRIRARAAKMIAEQRVVAEHCTLNSLGSDVQTHLPDTNIEASVYRGGQQRFDALFSDDDPSDRAQQARLIAKLVAGATYQTVADIFPDDVDDTSRKVEGPLHGSPAKNAPRRQRGLPTNATAPLERVMVSPYANPHPPKVKRVYEAIAASRPTATAPTIESRETTAQRLFQQLPPVIPSKPGFKQLAQRVQMRPSSALPPRCPTSAAVPSSRPATPSMHNGPFLSTSAATALNHFNPDDAIFTKEFYYLHVKIVHTRSQLQDWEFSVTVTDVTDPRRILRHTFRHLRVNSQRHIVFRPPFQVYLSPVDDIPWVAAPEALFMHTLRIEVAATYPTATKVVDTMVFFGDVVPSNSIATVHSSAPSTRRPASAPSSST